MKVNSTLISLAAMLLLIGSAVSTTLADSIKNVVVTNNTTYTMVALYASPTAYSTWDTTVNFFAGQTLLPGATVDIPIVDGISHCHYDLMAVLNGASQAAYTYSVNTCDGDTWTINASSQPGA